VALFKHSVGTVSSARPQTQQWTRQAPQDLRSLFFERCRALGATVAYAVLADDLSIATRITFEELEQRVLALASRLRSHCRPRDRVLLAFENGLDSVELFWACIVAGLVPIPAPAPFSRLSSGATTKRLEGIASDAGAELVLVAADQWARLERPPSASWMSLETLKAGAEAEFADVAVSGSDLAYLQYTSGSTSAPRGAELTHANVISHYDALVRAVASDKKLTSTLNWLPWFHDFGLLQGVVSPIPFGITSYLMPTVAFMRRPLSWLEAIGRYKVSCSGAPDSAYLACVRSLAGKSTWHADLGCWQLATCGAEPVRTDTVAAFTRAFAPHGFRATSFSAAYGLAEAVLVVTIKRPSAELRSLRVDADALARNEVKEIDDGASGSGRCLLSNGPPLDGIDVRIVDPERRVECPPGKIGEIWVRGASISKGYWGKPDVSAKILAATLVAGDKTPFLRTGDLGFVHDRELYVSGRIKDVIVSHGRNIYAQDVEISAEGAHASVRSGGVMAFGVERPGGEAVVVLAEYRGNRDSADIQGLVDAIRGCVSTQHGVEVHDVVPLKRGVLPYTSSGKPRRSEAKRRYLSGALGSGRLEAPQTSPKLREPRDATERLVAEAWMAVLGLETCDIDDNFFLKGGNSLTATQLVSRLNAVCGADLAIGAVFEAPTIEGLAQVLSRQSRQADGAAPAPSHVDRSRGKTKRGPLSFSQERIWFIHEHEPRSPAHNMPLAMRARGRLDIPLLETAMARVIERHEILRTTFESTASGVVSRIRPPAPFQFARRRTSQPVSASGSIDAALEAELARMTQEPFDLAAGPLMRGYIVHLGPDEAMILIVMHHVIGDQWSFAVLIRELQHFYSELLGDEVAPLPALPLQYAEYASWQRDAHEGAQKDCDERYWRTKLENLEPLVLPTDFPRPEGLLYKGARVRVPLDPALIQQLRTLGARHGASLSMVMMAALKVLLQRHSGCNDVAIGVPIANRNHAISETLIGTFVNMLVFRTEIDRNLDFASVLSRVRQTSLEAFAHQDMPFEHLVRILKHRRDASRTPLFQVMFNTVNVPIATLDLGEASLSRIDFDRRSAQFDLMVVVDADHDLSVGFEYATELFEPETIERIAGQYMCLLEHIVTADATVVAQIPMMSATEIDLIVDLGRGRDVVLQAETVVDWLRPSFASRADQTALIFGGQCVTYRDLDARSNAVAAALHRRGIGRGHRVGLAAARSVEMIVAQLAVLKSGAAYVPLDPANPSERLAYIANDAELALILTYGDQDAGFAAWAQLVPQLAIADALSEGASSGAQDVRASAPGPDDPAYVLYTSGSTGEPKGVVIRHRSVVNVLASLAVEPALTPGDRLLAVSTLSFDISVVETLLPLGAGAVIVLAGREDVGDGAALLRLIEMHGVTVMQATPSTWYLLLGIGWTGSPRFRKALVGGEPLPPDLASALVARCEEVWNMYGPTETTVWSTIACIDDPARISIGRPIANTQVYVLDPDLRPCPVGVEGELFIGGLGVGAGYAGRADLTASHFLADPFLPSVPGARFYRTGDRARWRNDGTLVCLGRTDSQVKLRGYRIELPEIEAIISRHPRVVRAAAAVREFAAGDQRLVAYVVFNGEAPDSEDLRAHLARYLPDYMIPKHIVALDALPLLSNGKVDRKALPIVATRSIGASPPVAPRNAVERAVWQIWRDVLGVEAFGVLDNFFDLGGHSMLAVRVVNRIAAEVDPGCTLPMLFQHPTIAELAAAMGPTPYRERPSLVALREQDHGPTLFCICGIHIYQELADHLAGHASVYAIFVPCELSILNGDAKSDFISVEELAADYRAELQKKQPHGPYYLAGLSFGGLLAYEIAQQLRRRGEEVALVAMFDTALAENRVTIAARKAVQSIRKLPKGGFLSGLWYGRRRVTEFIGSMRTSRKQDGSEAMEITDVLDARRAALRDAIYRRAIRRYKPRSYAGKAVLYRADDSKTPDTSLWWQELVQDLEVLHISGDHLDLIKSPGVGVVATQILARLV